VAYYIYAYCEIATFRERIFVARSTLYARMPKYRNHVEKMTDRIEDTKATSKQRFQDIAGRVPAADKVDVHAVFAHLHAYLTFEQFSFVNEYFEHVGLARMPGTLVRIRNADDHQTLVAKGAADGLGSVGGRMETKAASAKNVDEESLFIVNGGWGNFSILSVGTANFVRLHDKFQPRFSSAGKTRHKNDWNYFMQPNQYYSVGKWQTTLVAPRLPVQNAPGFHWSHDDKLYPLGGKNCKDGSGRFNCPHPYPQAFESDANRFRYPELGGNLMTNYDHPNYNMEARLRLYSTASGTGSCSSCNGRDNRQVMVQTAGHIPSDGSGNWYFCDRHNKGWRFGFNATSFDANCRA